MHKAGHIQELSLFVPNFQKDTSSTPGNGHENGGKPKSKSYPTNSTPSKKPVKLGKRFNMYENQSISQDMDNAPINPPSQSSDNIHSRFKNSVMRLQKAAPVYSSMIEDFFHNREKDAELSSRLDQLPVQNRRAIISELLHLSRALYSSILSSKRDEQIEAHDEPRASQNQVTGQTKVSESRSRGSGDSDPSESKASVSLPPISKSNMHTPEGSKRSHESRPSPAPKTVSIKESSIEAKSASPIVDDGHQGTDFIVENDGAEHKKEHAPAEQEVGERGRRHSTSGRESKMKLLSAVAKMNAIRSVFHQNSFFTDPEIAKRIFSLLSNKRSASFTKFMTDWKLLDETAKEEWVKELASQFVRIGTTLSVYSEATSCASPEESLNTLIRSMQSTVKTKFLLVYKVSDSGKHFSLMVSTFEMKNKEHSFDFGMGLVGQVIQSQEPVYMPTFERDQVTFPDLDDIFVGNAVYAHPLEDNADNTIGCIVAVSNQFSKEEIKLMEALSSLTGLILYNAILAERESQTKKRFHGLVEISNVVSSELRIQPLIDILRAKSRELLDADKCTIYIADHAKKELWTTLEEGNEIHFPLNQGIAGSVATTGNTINIRDAYEDDRFNSQYDSQTGYRTKSILCMPVKRRDNGVIVGVIQMINKRKDVFGKADEELLEAFCIQAAISITNSQAYGRELRERQKFQALVDISNVVSSELELDPLVDVLRSKSRELVQADRCTLFFANQEKKELYTKLLEGNEIKVPYGSGIVGYVAQEGVTLNIPDAYQEARFNQEVDKGTGYKTNTILCTPVKLGDGKVIGALQMVNKLSGEAFNKDDEDILSAFCAQAAIAIVNSQLYQETSELNAYMHSILASINHFVLHIGTNGKLYSVNHPLKELFGDDERFFKSHRIEEWFEQKNARLLQDVQTVLLSRGRNVYVENFNLVPKTVVTFKSMANISVHMQNSESDLPDAEETSLNQRISIPINYLVTPLQDSKGQPNGVLLIIEDLTQMELMRKEVDALQLQIGDIRSQATQMIEAPIQMVLRTVQHIAKGVLDANTAQKQLLECVSLMAQVDLFKPKIDEILDKSLDENTKRWIMNEVALPESANQPISRSWPDLSVLIREQQISDQTPEIIFNWELDATQYSDGELIAMIIHMFNHLNLLRTYRVEVETFQKFLESVRRNYHANPFHNFQHCFTATHVCFMILVKTSVAQYLSNLDIYSLMLSALCHDLDHPGLTNGFEISSESQRAILYNDVSVLENHHAHTAFRLLITSETNIIRHLPLAEFKEIRKSMIQSILGTDMGRHFEDLTKLGHRLEAKPLSRDSADDRRLIVSTIVHCADLSNPTRNFTQSRLWADRLLKEFSKQVSKEKENNLPVSTFMIIPNLAVQSKNEMNFIDYVVEPLWKVAKKMIPELEPIHAQLAKNRDEWSKLS